jgi:D-arabinose 1-dehydrogenase-like Zn-dependent alcohol dehydrogenase
MIELHYRTYPLDEVNDAYRDIVNGRIVGEGSARPLGDRALDPDID